VRQRSCHPILAQGDLSLDALCTPS
jgi:hypothetical protein